MPPAEHPPAQPSRVADLIGYVLLGGVVFAGVGALMSLFGEESFGEATGAGAVAGMLMGVLWFWQSQRAKTYRAGVDPTSTVLTPSEPAGMNAPPLGYAKARRYRNRAGTALAAVCLVGYAAFTFAVWEAPDAPIWFRAVVGGMFALTSGWLGAVWLTYTEVGPDGLRVRTPTRRHTVDWSNHSEVRWRREPNADVLLFCTKDGREIKAAGVGVTDMGYGKKRAALAMADIEKTWNQTAA
jgi:hypothetical protein